MAVIQLQRVIGLLNFMVSGLGINLRHNHRPKYRSDTEDIKGSKQAPQLYFEKSSESCYFPLISFTSIFHVVSEYQHCIYKVLGYRIKQFSNKNFVTWLKEPFMK